MQNRKFLKRLKVSYQVIGLNQDRLIAELKRRGLALYNVKKISNRVMYVSVNLNQSDNFFAITKNLCYNIKKVRLYGKALPLYKLLTNLGLVLGAGVLLALSLLANDFIFGFSFSGSGSVFKREVLQYLSERGITKYTRFSSFTPERLEDEILKDNAHLTFVSVQKRGNLLDVYLAVKTDQPQTLSGKVNELKADCAGVVESIKVYRGTALVNLGDSVSAGDVLVGGFAVIKEQTVQTNVLAYVTLLHQRAFTFRLSSAGLEQVALAMAEQELEKQTLSGSVSVKQISENVYEYDVDVEYRSVLYAG